MSSGAGPAPAVTPRGQRRREAVLDAAAGLFLAHGFHGTSVDDVGLAAGISGPGLYRHFASKDALLMAVLDRLWTVLEPAIERADHLPPREALTGLTDAHVAMVLDQPTALVLLVSELRHLPEDYRAKAARNHARYVDAWARPLRALGSRLSRDEARAAALAVHGLLDSTARSPGILPAPRRRELLGGLADAAIERAVAG